MTRETVKEWNGWILGYLDTEDNGDVTARAFSGVVLGYYRKSRNITTDFYGKMLYQGDFTRSLVIENAQK